MDIGKMQELLDRYHADILALDKGLNQCIAEKAALEVQNARLRAALRASEEEADYLRNARDEARSEAERLERELDPNILLKVIWDIVGPKQQKKPITINGKEYTLYESPLEILRRIMADNTRLREAVQEAMEYFTESEKQTYAGPIWGKLQAALLPAPETKGGE